MRTYSTISVLAVALLCTACAYNLGTAYPPAGKTKEQAQLDVLTCKDQAKVAANSAEQVAGNFLLGMTIIGAPIGVEREKAKAREVYAACMQERGYRVTPAT
jgi:hypothetical protein